MGILSAAQIRKMGFAHVGKNSKLSSKASYYNCHKISIGDNVRVDDFCLLSAGAGGICIESYIHIGAYSSLIGAGGIYLRDFCGLSSRVTIYSSSDDYSGSSMTNPMVSSEFTNVTHADVIIGRHVIVGAGSVILPGSTLEEGVAIGALSLVSKNCNSYGVYFGVPAKRIKERKKGFLIMEQQFLRK